MWNKLQQYFAGRHFHEVDLHMEHSKLYYIAEGTAVNMVWLLREELLQGLSAQQYQYYQETIRGIFVKQGYSMVSILALFLTSDISGTKEMAEGSMFWIVDESYGRLVVYENQPEDFLGLRGMIENNLRFGGDSRNSQGAQRTVDQDNFRSQCKTVDFTDAKKKGSQDNRAAYRAYAKQRRRKDIQAWTRRWRERSWCVGLLIIVNVFIFLCTDLFQQWQWLEQGGLSWMLVFDGEWYRILTSMFLHFDLGHISSNMLALFGVGGLVEQRLGHLRFAILYFLSGIGAGGASLLYHWQQDENVLSAGASGAIYGVMGAVVIMLLTEANSRSQENIFRVGIFLLLLFSSVFTGENVDNAAHIGGFLIGAACYLIMISVEKSKWQRMYR